ncbi:MAG: SDR family NAD(P)-dependent oxidoreductase [Candidatus Nezhaarchaeales archaeon]
MSKVLVTGGAGFIGSHLVDILLQEGFEVVVLDNLSTGSLDNIRAHTEKQNFQFIRGDVVVRDVVRRALRDVKYVFHLAAIANIDLSVRRPDLVNRVNVTGTVNLLEESRRADVERFLFTSSCAVYGEPVKIPVDEEHSTRPLSPYGASKLAAEHYCMVYHRAYGLETVVLRLFNVYGPRQERSPYGGVISSFINRLKKGLPPIIFGDGTQTRDFIYVSDAVEALMLAMKTKRCTGMILNIGSGIEVSIREIAERLTRIFGLKVRPIFARQRAGDVRRMCADTKRAKEVLGFETKISLDEGLKTCAGI